MVNLSVPLRPGDCFAQPLPLLLLRPLFRLLDSSVVFYATSTLLRFAIVRVLALELEEGENSVKVTENEEEDEDGTFDGGCKMVTIPPKGEPRSGEIGGVD